MELKQWRQDEESRREEERYERKILRQIGYLLNDGAGGSPEEADVRSRLSRWLTRIAEEPHDDESDPTLADIIWWKGEHVAVIEVSLKVNGLDVLRAKRRAQTLQRAGIDVIPIVIGEEWAHPETKTLAQQEGVEWLVAKEFSPGLIEFRKLPAETVG